MLQILSNEEFQNDITSKSSTRVKADTESSKAKVLINCKSVFN